MNRRIDPATCSQCRPIFLLKDAPHLPQPKAKARNGVELCRWSKSRSALERSVEAGCPLCRAFQARFRGQYLRVGEKHLEQLADMKERPSNSAFDNVYSEIVESEIDRLEKSRKKHDSSSVDEDGDVEELRLQIRLDMEKPAIMAVRALGYGEKNFLSFRLLAEQDDPAASYVDGRFPPPDVVSQRAFATARGFLATCDNTHPNCVKLNTSKLPTRVIAVSPSESSYVPYIYTTNEATGRYAALSYCWGYNPDCKTMKATLEAHSSALPLDRLPQTILDAITVTRELSIPYLWVDALCIVQDDEDDMATELARMVEIYRNAYFTISAASASDSRDGFLSDRQLTSVIKGSGPIYLPYRTKAGSDGPVGMVGLVKNSIRGVVRDHIHSRAWTLQEHILAPRLLVYGSVQLFCICGTKTLACGDQYSLGNRIDRRLWERLYHLLSPSKKGQDAVVLAKEAPLSPEEQLRFDTIGFLFTTVLDSMPGQPFAYKDNPLDKIVLDMTMCRLLAELSKVRKGVLDPKLAETFAENVKSHLEDWTVMYGQRATQEVRNQAAVIIWTAWQMIQKPSSEYADTLDAFPHLWKGIVEEFTSRGLGYHSDKLPALAAIAEVVGTTFKDEYVVGHWRRYLLPQLLWRVGDLEKVSRPRNTELAHHPSWSWASIDGQVEMWPFDLEIQAKTPVATVLECTKEFAHDIVPYGRIKSAMLVIRGWLQPVVVDEDGKTARPRRRTCHNDAPINIRLDHLDQIPEGERSGKKDIKWALPLARVVPVVEWGIGNEDRARGIAGLLLDLTEKGAIRIGAFSGNCSPSHAGGVAYEDAANLNKRFTWLLAGSQTIVSLI